MDETSRRGRSVLGVNIQYLAGKKIIVRTLGLDLEVAHTAENIKNEDFTNILLIKLNAVLFDKISDKIDLKL